MTSNTSLRRVAVTGMGAICGLGKNVSEVWGGILNGNSGIFPLAELKRLSPTFLERLPVKFAGVIKDYTISPDLIPEKEQGRYDLFVHYAVHAAHEALAQAQEGSGPLPYSPENIGVILGVGLGGFPLIEESYQTFLDKGARRVGPFFIPSVIPNMASGLIGIRHNLQGINYSIASACASSGHAIAASATEIMLGRQEMMVTGGSEAVICSLPFSGFTTMKALSKRDDEPQKASRPFDISRDGFVMGEGAGLIILEDLEKAKARGATIYAELVGQGASCDANHITAPHPEGLGARKCIELALKAANISPEAIGYINAHGTSTPLGDIAETKAIKLTFGAHAKKLQVSSTKSMTGHLLGAAGGIESIFCIKALHEGILPPTINLDQQDPECDLNYIPHRPLKKQVEYALNNSFGFGGTNSCLIFKHYQ